jgi:hypothetical protein
MQEDIVKFEKYCDVILVDEKTGKEWKMIKALLCIRSEYFEKLFSLDWNNSNQTKFKIQTNDAWDNIRSWILTGAINFDDKQLVDILVFADMYQFKDLMKYSIKKLEDSTFLNITQDNFDFLFQPRFFGILAKHSQIIMNNFFQQTPFFAFFASFAYKILKNNSQFCSSSWITKCSTFNYEFNSVSKKMYGVSKTKPIEMKLFNGVYVKYTSHFINKEQGSYSTHLQSKVYGCDSSDGNPEKILIWDGSKINPIDKYFNKFIFESYGPDWQNETITSLPLYGESIVLFNQ